MSETDPEGPGGVRTAPWKPGFDAPDASEAPDAVTLERAILPGRATAVAATLAQPSSQPRMVDPSPASLDSGDFGDRYALRRLLGEGGMGEVQLCKDGRIGREVAIKLMRAGEGSRSDSQARFLREARIQGQLEHPSVVPVYDLGVDPSGRPYFTMKRVNGHTLEQIVQGLRANDAAMLAHYTRRRLLGALSSVCLALAFAHSRGVVHRDLKPANVMLGEFGEVHVLDWGVARVAGTAEVAFDGPGSGGAIAATQAGMLMGTPGYMAPEQARGEIDRVDARADVYALGAILFELLALEPLHRGATVQALLVATVTDGSVRRPSERAPERDVPPELDAICVHATELDPDERFASARELHDAIESFLDGQKDTERRRELAQRHTLAAQVALALASRGGTDAEAQRAKALRALTSALALDPTHEGAVRTMMRVLLDPSGELPPEAEQELKEIERRDRARGSKAASLAYFAWLLLTPFMLWMGVRSWLVPSLIGAVVLALALYTAWMGHTGKASRQYFVWVLPGAHLAIGLLAGMFGPFVLVPAVAVANSASVMVSIRANRETRRGLLWLGLGVVCVPAILQAAGVLPASYAYEDGVMKILPHAVELPAAATFVTLLVASILTIAAANLLVGRAVQALKTAERQQFVQAWRLRQLLPEGAGAPALREAPPDACRVL
jgi:serine/threonine-protein kinase